MNYENKVRFSIWKMIFKNTFSVLALSNACIGDFQSLQVRGVQATQRRCPRSSEHPESMWPKRGKCSPEAKGQLASPYSFLSCLLFLFFFLLCGLSLSLLFFPSFYFLLDSPIPHSWLLQLKSIFQILAKNSSDHLPFLKVISEGKAN